MLLGLKTVAGPVKKIYNKHWDGILDEDHLDWPDDVDWPDAYGYVPIVAHVQYIAK